MSYAVDVNVLLYASDSSSPHHEAANSFLQHCASESEPLCLAWLTVMSYLRMATHAAIFDRPLTPRQAQANMDALLSLPHCRLLGELEHFWTAYQEVTTEIVARGKAVPDAHLATILRQHGVLTLWTRDRDFSRFEFLTVRDPFA